MFSENPGWVASPDETTRVALSSHYSLLFMSARSSSLYQLVRATLEPEPLRALLGPHEPLLLKLFNPAGWLDITFLDSDLRIGRDDKGLIYVMERCKR